MIYKYLCIILYIYCIISDFTQEVGSSVALLAFDFWDESGGFVTYLSPHHLKKSEARAFGFQESHLVYDFLGIPSPAMLQ